MKVTHVMPRHADTIISEQSITVSLASVPGVVIAPDRRETAPTMPTIRTHAPKRLHGAALASSDARKVDELAALIYGYRSASLPAVTAAMEGL